MLDEPYPAERSPEYYQNVTKSLEEGSGVAVFLVSTGAGEKFVLYCTHELAGRAGEISQDPRPMIRAAQAVVIQREARQQAAGVGLNPVVA